MNPLRWWQRARWYRERSEELAAYLEAETAENEARGLAPAAALAAARRRLGNRTRILEAIWDSDTPAWLDTLWRDLRYAARRARQAPGGTLAAAAILALGIGANVAMYTVARTQLSPLPFPHPEQLAALLETSPGFARMGVSYPDYLDWRASAHAFREMAAMRGSDMILSHRGPPAMVVGARVTAGYFALLGVAPVQGRTFSAGEDRPGGAPVVVISDRFWRERLGGDPHILGESVSLDGVARTVIGVMPPGFPGLQPAGRSSEFWTPLGAFAGEDPDLMQRGNHPGILVLGRLRSGVTAAAARADMAAVTGGLAADHPATNRGVDATVQSYLELVAGDTRTPLEALLAAVGVVLLIACANVAGLWLARAATRQPVAALRVALGATRARLMREHSIEALGLGAAGGAAGLGVAWLGLHIAAAALAASLPRPAPNRPDAAMLEFALGAALLTSLLCGLAPAWYAARAPVAPLLNEGGRGAARPARAGHRLRSALVATETALALVLLLGAAFALRTLQRLERTPAGFNAPGTLTFIVGLPATQYPAAEQQLGFFRETLARMGRLPGVRAAGGIFPLPFGGDDWSEPFTYAGRPAPEPGREPSTDVATVRGDVFSALGMTVLCGRTFSAHDDAAAPPVAVVDSNLVAAGWPGAGSPAVALGRQIGLDGVTRTIVGVVEHVRNGGFGPDDDLETFIPQDQSGSHANGMYYVLRSASGDAGPLRAPALAALAAVDPNQPATDMQTMEERLTAALADRRNTLALLGAFALLALVLAASGTYGVMAYVAAQRRHEIGVRMALGARRGQVTALVLGQGMRLAGAGLGLGMGLAWGLSRLAGALLPGAEENSAVTLCAAPLLLAAALAFACWWPARRAAGMDPGMALRGE